MNHEQRNAKTKAFGPPQGPEFPAESGFTPPPQNISGLSGPPAQYPVPFSGGGPGNSLASNFNMNELKNMIDRMGGVDGILNTMQKVNKLMQTVQQMTPMLKLFLGSFGKAKTTDMYDDDDYYPKRRRRRKRRRKYSGSRRKRRKTYRSKQRRRR